ncbi:hypothetical protein NEOC95_002390 [Neochlamydia sp. AcF95]|nr:hypothetical protein [Neochlamydia sp. AcF95]
MKKSSYRLLSYYLQHNPGQIEQSILFFDCIIINDKHKNLSEKRKS